MKPFNRALAVLGIVLSLVVVSAAGWPAETSTAPTDAHIATAASLNNEGERLRSLGRIDEAEPLFRKSLAMTLEAFGPWHVNVAVVKLNLGKLLMHKAQLDRAEVMFVQARKIYERVEGPDGPAVAGTLHSQAMIHLRRNEFTQAELLCRRSMAISQKAGGRDTVEEALSLNALGLIEHARRKYDKAEVHFRDCLRILRSSRQATIDEARVLGNLGRLLWDQKRTLPAREALSRALELHRVLLGETHWETQSLTREWTRLDH